MKIFLGMVLFVSFVLASDFATQMGYETNYKVALQKAKEHNKQIVFILVSSHCPWCEKLEEEVLSLEYTNELLHKYYIPLLQYSREDSFPSKFDSYVVPSIHFIDSKDEKIVETVLGFNNNWRFFEIIEANK